MRRPALTLALLLATGAAAGAAPVELVTRLGPGQTADTGSGASSSPAVSADGRYIAFTSTATNLVAADFPPVAPLNVFLYDQVAGTMTLVSHGAASPAVAAHGSSYQPAISADGRWVTFESDATDLVAGQSDANGGTDVFLWDRLSGTTALISHASSGAATAGDAGSAYAVPSQDGSWIAFTSQAGDLVAGQADTAGSWDLFLYERASGNVTLVSHAAGAPTAARGGHNAMVSGDGSRVLFLSEAVDLVPGQVDSAAGTDVFLYDPAADATILVSRAAGSTATAANDASYQATVSADGRFVAFTSLATNVVAGQSSPAARDNVFLFDRLGGTVLVSHTAGNPTQGGSAPSFSAVVSADGSAVAYASQAGDLDSAQTATGTEENVFLYSAGASRQASPPAGGGGSRGDSGEVAVAADGSFLAFTSAASDLVAQDTNLATDVFLYSRSGDAVTAVTHRDPGLPSVTGRSSLPSPVAVSADGRFVLYQAESAPLLLPGLVDANQGDFDLFLLDRFTGTTQLVDHSVGAPLKTANAGVSGASAMSADGRFVAFTSRATDLVDGFVGGFLTASATPTQVFLYDRTTGTVGLVSHVDFDAAVAPDDSSRAPSLSADGRYVAYVSDATDLLSDQTDDPGTPDVFLYDQGLDASVLVSQHGHDRAAGGDAPVVAADGSRVAFLSNATDLVAGQVDGNGGADVFLYDRASRALSLMSGAGGSASHTANAPSSDPLLAADGGAVLFASAATDLVPGQVDGNGTGDLFLHAVASGTTRLVSAAASSPAQAGNGASYGASLSADGTVVAFRSEATDLVIGGSGPGVTIDLFVRDLNAGGSGVTTLVSRTEDHPGDFQPPASLLLAADGGRAVFTTTLSGQPPGLVDGNSAPDVFSWERSSGAVTLLSHTASADGTTGNAGSSGPVIAQDGRHVLFASSAADLVSDDFNSDVDLFLYSAPPLARDFYTLPPCRLLDTRQAAGGALPLASGGVRTIKVTGLCGIPATAGAIAVNLTDVDPGSNGRLTLYPGHTGVPLASTINFKGGVNRANNAVVPLALDGTGTLSLTAFLAADGATVHAVIDVVGYFQ